MAMDDAQLDQLAATIAEALPGAVTGKDLSHGMLTLLPRPRRSSRW